MLLTAKLDGLPIVNFAVGGIATPVDAALIMWLDADGVFVGSSIFKSGYPEALPTSVGGGDQFINAVNVV